VDDVDAAFMEQNPDAAELKWEPHVEHHSQTDDLRTGFEVLKRAAFCHPKTLQNRPAR